MKPLSFDRQMVAYADLCDQRIVIDVLDNATQRVARHEAVLFDQMMEQRLVELGWTPPGGKA